MKTGILVALAALAVVGVGVAGAAIATSSHPTYTASQGGYGGGMMNGGNGMMGGQYGGGVMGGGNCPYQGNYQYCQQYMYEHNYTYGGCPMMG